MTLRQYFVNFILALTYALLFGQAYVTYLNFHFEYAGFTLYPRTPFFIVSSLAIAVAPIALYRGVRAVSSIVSVCIYQLLYIPIILTFALGSSRSPEEITFVQFVFLIGMSVVFLVDRVLIQNPFFLRSRISLMIPIAVLTALLIVYVLITYRGNLRFASFGEAVYEQRSATTMIGAGAIARYLTSWLGQLLIPLCLAYGLTSRRLGYFVLGSVGCFVLYLAAAAKIVIVLPIIFLGFYVVFAGERVQHFYPLFTLSLIALIFVATRLTDPTSVGFLFSSLVLWRTIGNGGQLTSAYYDFFTNHAQTNYSHVNIVNSITHAYPYGTDGLGKVIGTFFWNDDSNANANFWATDGIAALGLTGVLVSSLLCAALLVTINSVTRQFRRMFVVLCFIPTIISILNTSLFSTMFTGGGGLLILFFLFHRTESSTHEPASAVS